ncbi:MAG: HIT domain-containing protein [Candidatus Microthrix sp.]|nr:HIT domain-containing protein [Candidatus Microthrix sp.]MBK6439718.1 HIT domain-containing protein [Candidatus Microthrix sp.]
MTLDHLWSTWRSNYVSTLGDPPGDAEGTLFERILGAPEGDREKFVVARGRRCFALLNLFPYTAGHVMVLPNRGVAGLDDLNDEEFAELWAMVRDATVACREGAGLRRRQRRRQPRGGGRRLPERPSARPRRAPLGRRRQLHDRHRRHPHPAGVAARGLGPPARRVARRGTPCLDERTGQ